MRASRMLWSIIAVALLCCDPCIAFQLRAPFAEHRKVQQSRCSKVKLAVTSASSSVDPPSTSLKIREDQLDLSTGVSAQVLSCRPSRETNQPPLVFIHGSFHAAWCWTERYFPHFVSLGYPVVALSLRGTGGTAAGEGVRKVKIEEHAQDLQAFLSQLPIVLGAENNKKPVLVAHSFGGLALMKYLEMNPEEASQLAGVITICSVPPSGNGPMTLRYLRRSLVDSWKITRGFAMKKSIKNASLCRDLFFGGKKETMEDGSMDDYGVSDEDIERYQRNFERDTVATIDISNLVKNLPSAAAVEGRAPFLSQLPPCLVVGAERDFIVDREGVEETAEYFGLDKPIMVASPHDVMLGRNWRQGADAIHLWIQETIQPEELSWTDSFFSLLKAGLQ